MNATRKPLAKVQIARLQFQLKERDEEIARLNARISKMVPKRCPDCDCHAFEFHKPGCEYANREES